MIIIANLGCGNCNFIPQNKKEEYLLLSLQNNGCLLPEWLQDAIRELGFNSTLNWYWNRN